MIYEKNNCKFIDINIDYIEKHLSNNSIILLKPYINGKISCIKYDNGELKCGLIKSKEFVPFEHDFLVDIEKNNYDPIFMTMFKCGRPSIKLDNCFLLGKFSNITAEENITKIFFSGDRITPFMSEFDEEINTYCGLQIKKENSIYSSSLTKDSFEYDDDCYYYNITYLVGNGTSLKSSLYSLEQQINAYSYDEIIKLLAKKHNETDLRFKFDEQKKVLSLTKKN